MLQQGVGRTRPELLQQRAPVGLPHWNTPWIEILQTEHVDAIAVRRGTLAVKRIDAADPAEEVPRGLRIETILREKLFAAEQLEGALMHLHHQRVLARTDGAVTHREFRKICFYLEFDGAAVAASHQGLHGSNVCSHMVVSQYTSAST